MSSSTFIDTRTTSNQIGRASTVDEGDDENSDDDDVGDEEEQEDAEVVQQRSDHEYTEIDVHDNETIFNNRIDPAAAAAAATHDSRNGSLPSRSLFLDGQKVDRSSIEPSISVDILECRRVIISDASIDNNESDSMIIAVNDAVLAPTTTVNENYRVPDEKVQPIDDLFHIPTNTSNTNSDVFEVQDKILCLRTRNKYRYSVLILILFIALTTMIIGSICGRT